MGKHTDASYVGHAERSNWPLWLKLTLLIAGGILVGLVSLQATNHLYRQTLLSRASAIGSALDAEQVKSLASQSDPHYKQDYNYLKQKMTAIREATDGARFVYLMGNDTSRGVYFMVDSEQPSSSGFSPNGQMYPEASEKLRSIFTNNQRLVEGPVGDRWGQWLSALAPVNDSVNGKLVAVVGIDIAASTYYTYLALAGGIPIALALLAAMVVYNTESMRRRRQETLRFRSELVSIASHELRSPLAGLRWSQELMMSYKLDEKTMNALRLMHNSTLKLQESIEDVLQLANLQSEKHSLDVVDVEMTKLFDDVFLVQQPAAIEHEIVLERSKTWPKVLWLRADERRLKRVFNNLISNAVKYSKPKTPVTVGYLQTRDEHIMTISDHGIGIPRADQTKVFSGFFRADNARKASVSGTGMGLYLSRAIVEQHGGRLWLDSSEQAGTTVYVAFPVKLGIVKPKID